MDNKKNNYILKKGAMFGLDARIALAIFGTLSVISGASLYSAIKESKIVSIITEIKEIEKALTAYYLDTGSYPSHATTNPARDLNAADLKQQPTGVYGWKGPYFKDTDSTSKFIVTSIIPNSTLTYRNADDWSDYNSDSECKKSGDKCVIYIWVGITDLSILKALEKKIDNNELTTSVDYTGRFRVHSNGFFIKTDVSYPNSLAVTA